jgi:hypothetical protein
MSKTEKTLRSGRKPSSGKPARSHYRIRNWAQYNQSLVQRGSIVFWISTLPIRVWKPATEHHRGGQFDYSDTAIECLLMLRSVFHLTLRATEGFAQFLLQLMKLSGSRQFSAPNFKHVYSPRNQLKCRSRVLP